MFDKGLFTVKGVEARVLFSVGVEDRVAFDLCVEDRVAFDLFNCKNNHLIHPRRI